MRILIISGASRGIGASAAENFLAHDWHVVNLSRSEPKQKAIQHLTVDFFDLEQLTKKIVELDDLLKKAQQVCLVHNTMHYEHDTIQTIQPHAFQRTLAANLMAPNILNQALIPKMPRGSSIIYIGSTLSEKAVPGAASYAICKHAIVGMMRATCQDLATQGVHTSCICPGFTDTEMLREHVGNDPKILKMLQQRVGANRLIAPEEIADLIWFCAQNPVINGAVIHANLGQIET